MKENYTDKKTGISYTLKGDYYIPNLYFKEEEKIFLSRIYNNVYRWNTK